MRKSEIVVRLTLDATEVASLDRMVAECGDGSRAAWVNHLVREVIADELQDKAGEVKVKQRRSV